MGGESIKPIRKRIHVYFLMTTYRNDEISKTPSLAEGLKIGLLG